MIEVRDLSFSYRTTGGGLSRSIALRRRYPHPRRQRVLVLGLPTGQVDALAVLCSLVPVMAEGTLSGDHHRGKDVDQSRPGN